MPLAERGWLLHNVQVILAPQDVPAQPPNPELLQQLQTLTWVDHTALGVLLVFFVIGLFKGLIWQVSRIAILVVAYVITGRFGGTVADLIAGPPAEAPPGTPPPAETTIYLAYVLLFLAVLIVLSLLAMLLQKLAAKAGLGFFDRLGGGVLGVATGGCVVLFGLAVVHMFFQGSQIAAAAGQSRSMQWSTRAIDWLGERVPDDLRKVFGLVALHPVPAPGMPLPGTGQPGGQEGQPTVPGTPPDRPRRGG
ncbi:MAG: CvpA family protein [Planctomycetota bacterium]